MCSGKSTKPETATWASRCVLRRRSCRWGATETPRQSDSDFCAECSVGVVEEGWMTAARRGNKRIKRSRFKTDEEFVKALRTQARQRKAERYIDRKPGLK